jgi:peptidoglycan/xylan/chitin deacetylase (PgdA/CDA1 family)
LAGRAPAFYDPFVMLRIGLRVLMPVASLALGTWLGLGRPDRGVMFASTQRAWRSIAGRAGAPAARIIAPPLESVPQTADVAMAPRPPAPLPSDFPHLNPDETIPRAWLLAEGPYHAPGDNHGYITFTFDDGPFPETTPHVLDLLARFHVRATFFFIGRYLDGNDVRSAMTREVARRIVAEGHLVGNHTYDHMHLTEVSRPQALSEIDRSAEAIERVTGQRPLFFRPPYGDLSHFLERTLAERETEVVLWSLAADDMERDDEKAVAHELRLRLEFAGGGVVLLHDCKWKSVIALERLLRWLDDNRWDPMHPDVRGYEVVDLPEYLRMTAASPQPFANREELDNARKAAWKKAHPDVAAPAMPPGRDPGS